MDPNNAIYFSNRAVVHLKMNNYQKAIEDAEKGIAIDPKFSKCYYRRAKANESLNNYYKACSDFIYINFLEKDGNSDVKKELEGLWNKL